MSAIKRTMEEFAEFKGIELSDIDNYIKENPNEWDKFLKGNKGVCLNCGQEIDKCRCIPDEQIKTFKTEEQMIQELREDIRRLKIKMLVKETEHRRSEKVDVDGAMKDVTEIRRKQEVRDMRGILKDKLTTFNLYMEAKEITGN